MKLTFISTAVLALALSGASLTGFAKPPPAKLLGDPAPATVAARTIVIRPNTKSVNVVGGETVRFKVDGKSFAWSFNVPETVTSFDLNRVAPADMLDHKVKVYVATDPKYKHETSN